MVALWFGLLAGLVTALALIWPVPMMLWDHLDLLPMLVPYLDGTGDVSSVIATHGGHSHSAANLTLLVTTSASGGQPWLDIFVSCIFLGFAALAFLWALGAAGGKHVARSAVGIMLLCFLLSPMHLPNLQWGWQVAVFICLFGVGLGLAAAFSQAHVALRVFVGMLGIGLALSSFATGVALLPAMLLGLWLDRNDQSLANNICAFLWIAFGLFAMWWLGLFQSTGSVSIQLSDVFSLLAYCVNYLAGGIARYATDLAWPLVTMGWGILIFAYLKLRHTQRQLLAFWITLAVFSLGAAMLTALGRAVPFGADHAFATRYASFSGLYWLAVVGATMSLLWALPGRQRVLKGVMIFILTLGVVNALHIAKKARTIHLDAVQTAEEIRTQWPDVDDATLRAIYFDDAQEARARLEQLRQLQYPPFDSGSVGATE